MLASIAALLGLMVLVLALPVDLSFRLRGLEAFAGQVTVRWLFGLVRFRFDLPRARPSKPPEPEPEPASEPARPRRGAGGARWNILPALREPAFRQRSYRLAGDLARAAHLRELGLRVRLGLGDPADTGRLWALVGPIDAAAKNLRNAEVRIEPEFGDAVLEFDARGRVVLFPVQLVALLASFALSPPAIRAWRASGRRRG